MDNTLRDQLMTVSVATATWVTFGSLRRERVVSTIPRIAPTSRPSGDVREGTP